MTFKKKRLLTCTPRKSYFNETTFCGVKWNKFRGVKRNTL